MIHASRDAGRPWHRSINASGSVYWPEVSYRYTGGLDSAPKLAGVGASVTSRIGTRMSARLPGMYTLREFGNGWVTALSNVTVLLKIFSGAALITHLDRRRIGRRRRFPTPGLTGSGSKGSLSPAL